MPLSKPAFEPRSVNPWVLRITSLLWVLVVLAVGLAITWNLAESEQAREQAQRRRDFQNAANRVVDRLQNELENCELVLRSMQSLFLASREVGAEEYATAFANLDVQRRMPSLQALAYAERRPGPGGDRFVTTLAEPLARNRDVIGLEVNRQPVNLRPLMASLQSDQVAMSANFRLIQPEVRDVPGGGIIMRLPVFTPGARPRTPAERVARFRGSIGASFVVQRLISTALDGESRSRLHMRVLDVSEGAPQVLYRSEPGQPDARHDRSWRQLAFGGRSWRIEMVDKDGTLPPLRESRLLQLGLVSTLLSAALVLSLATTRVRAIELGQSIARRHRDSEERFRLLNELLPTLVLLMSQSDRRIVYANLAARTQLGVGEWGAPIDEVLPPSVCSLLDAMHEGQNMHGEAELVTANGSEFSANISVSPVEIDGRPMWLLVASDVSELRELTERLSYAASHDALTRLPNRQEFEFRLRGAIDADDGVKRALLFIDLDQFKLINDTSGHMAGDQLLVQLAMLMREKVGEKNLLARLGGDEFGVLLCEDIHDVADAQRHAENLRRAVDGYVFMWEQRSYTISASIGGAMIEPGESTLVELLAQVDTACYLSKESGRNRVHFYSADDDASARRRNEMDWANRLRWAIDENRLLLAYQELHPLNAQSDEPGIYVELLLRLADEEGKLVTPGAFMPAAERFGLMPRIDRWVIETALANIDRLHPLGAALALCAINLSAASLEDDDIVGFIVDALDRHDVDPRRVMFEITETVAVRNMGRVSELIGKLRALGCRIALDDFGAGMSSFGYLKNLAVDTIKIDGAFVFDIERDSISHSIVRAISEIGHQHGLVVVAEWVSTQSQAAALAAVGVDYAQGFGLHYPELALFNR